MRPKPPPPVGYASHSFNTFSNLEPGRYTLLLFPEQIERPIHLRPGQQLDLVFDLSRTCLVSLRGKLADGELSSYPDIPFHFHTAPIPPGPSKLPLYRMSYGKARDIPMQPGWIYLRSASSQWVFPTEPLQVPIEGYANL